jgi:GAF domain-containing protein
MIERNEPLTDPRRRRLSAQHALSRIIGSLATLEEGAARILEVLGQSLGAQVGELWIANHDREVLELRGLWHDRDVGQSSAEPEDLRAWREIVFRRDAGLPGAVFELGIPIWLTDVLNEEVFLRREIAARLGLHGVVAFPVLFAGSSRGVLQFFYSAARVPEDEVLEIFSDVGAQVGAFLERLRLVELVAEQAQKIADIQRALGPDSEIVA